MRLSNKKKIPTYNFIQTLLWMGVAAGIILFWYEKRRLDFLGQADFILIAIPVLLLVLFWLRGKQVFEYDSDGETLSINNYSIIPFFRDQNKDEFPKYKLKSFKVVSSIFSKKILISIHSKKSHQVILKYEISYLGRSELRDLKISLGKIVKAKENNVTG